MASQVRVSQLSCPVTGRMVLLLQTTTLLFSTHRSKILSNTPQGRLACLSFSCMSVRPQLCYLHLLPHYNTCIFSSVSSCFSCFSKVNIGHHFAFLSTCCITKYFLALPHIALSSAAISSITCSGHCWEGIYWPSPIRAYCVGTCAELCEEEHCCIK